MQVQSVLWMVHLPLNGWGHHECISCKGLGCKPEGQYINIKATVTLQPCFLGIVSVVRGLSFGNSHPWHLPQDQLIILATTAIHDSSFTKKSAVSREVNNVKKAPCLHG